MGRAKISVVIPAYNAAATLAATFASVYGQSLPPDEIVVVDDGSTDGTAALVRAQGERVRYAYQENSGPSAARNRGLEMASGDLITFLDADDLWLEYTLALLAEKLAKDETSMIAKGRSAHMWPGEEAGEFVFDAPEYSFNVGSALFRREVFTLAGAFDPAMRHCEDVDFWIRVRELGIKEVLVEETIHWYRRRGPFRYVERELYLHNLLHTVKRSVVRQREVGA